MPAMPYLAIVAAVGLRRLQALARGAWPAIGVAGLAAAGGARGAGGAGLPAGAGRDPALAPRRAVALQPAGGRLRRRGLAGDEPAVLGLFRAAHPRPVRQAVPPSRATYWHDVLPDALNYYVRDGRLPPGLGNVGTEPATSPARTSACCSPSATSRCSRACSGRATAPPAPSWSAPAKGCRWSSSTADGVCPNEPERHRPAPRPPAAARPSLRGAHRAPVRQPLGPGHHLRRSSWGPTWSPRARG